MTVFLPEQISLLVITGIVLLVPRLRAAYFASPPPSAPPEPRGRDPFLDIAKAIAIVAVIVIHVGYFFFTNEPETMPETMRIVNNLLRFAIPWFLIVTGAVLPQISDARAFYRKRIAAISVPYLLATALIVLSERADAGTALWWIATGKASVPYYYILVLLQCYLLYPFLLRHRSKRWFIPAAFAVTLFSFLSSSTWYFHGFPFVGPYLFFFCYGLAFRPTIRGRAQARRDLAAWGAIALLGATFLIAVPVPTYNTSLFYGVALFRLFLAAEPFIRRMPFAAFLSRIGENTFWVFLSHMTLVGWIYGIARQYLLTLTIAIPASILAGYFLCQAVKIFQRQFCPSVLDKTKINVG